MAEIKRLGEIRFVLEDERSMEGNESIDCTYALYGDEGDEILSIEDYYYKCKYFLHLNLTIYFINLLLDISI